MPKVNFEREFEPNKIYVFEMKGRSDLTGFSGRMMHVRTESAIQLVDPDTATAIMTKCCRYVAPVSQD